jgi:regulator of sigma E protease
MSFLLSTIAFFVLLTLLVLIHELGHFVVAKWSKVTVDEFGFGLPPMAKKLFTWKNTLFSLNWIPFGGFVRMKGENSMDPNVRNLKGSFAAASIPKRLAILMAGVFMNFILAISIYTAGFWLFDWVPTYLSVESLNVAESRGDAVVDWGLYVTEISSGGGADGANVMTGGVLMSVNGNSVFNVDDVLVEQEGKSSVEYVIEYKLEEAEEVKETEEKKFIVQVDNGKTGIALSRIATNIEIKDVNFFGGIGLALRESWTVTSGTVDGITSLFKSLIFVHGVPEGIAGIVGIAQLTHNSIQEGMMVYLRLVALLSLSLAVLNILPFPALDGGRVVFVIVEMIIRKPVNRRLEVITNAAGIIFLMAVMVAVTWNDILRIFSS